MHASTRNNHRIDDYQKQKVLNMSKRVVVVGAGAAGLGAARWLLNNAPKESIEVIVLEARDRIGGRVHTAGSLFHDADSCVYDFGASWLHESRSTNPITQLAAQINSSFVMADWHDEEIRKLDGSTLQLTAEEDFDEEELEYRMIKESAKIVKLYQKNRAPLPMLEEIAKKCFPRWSSEAMQAFVSGLEFLMGTSLHKVSLLTFDETAIAANNNERYPASEEPMFAEGYGSLLQALVTGTAAARLENFSTCRSGYGDNDRVDVRLQHEVQSIDQSTDSVVVRAVTSSNESVTFHADAVLVTVPLGVLKTGLISFSPPLSPQKQSAIDNCGVGNVVKVILRFESAFWSNKSDFLYVLDRDLMAADVPCGERKRGLFTCMWNAYHSTGKPVIVAYGLGDAADMIDKMTLNEVVRLVMSRISLFVTEGRAVLPPLFAHRSNWSTDRYSMGAYSHAGKTFEPGMWAELGRAEDAIFFAGEACNESWITRASVRGAYESGVRSAAAIAKRLQMDVNIPFDWTILDGVRSL